MSDRSERSPTLRLAELQAGDLVEILSMPQLSTSASETAMPFREGEVLQCLYSGEEGVLVRGPDGAEYLVAPAYGQAAIVRLFWEPARGWIPDDRRGIPEEKRRAI